MKRRVSLLLIAMLVVLAPSAALLAEEEEPKPAKKRARLDGVASETLDRLFEKRPKAKALYDRAYGYAVFSNVKISLMITGGGGNGVAVDKGSGARTYMKMATGGLNLGFGGQKYQVVFLFEDKQTFDSFVHKGWEAEASANAAAGKHGKNVEANFRNGMAVYQFTDKGLMLQADISGTKYWKNKNLN